MHRRGWVQTHGCDSCRTLARASIEVDVPPPQAVPFFIIGDGDEFRTAGSGVGE